MKKKQWCLLLSLVSVFCLTTCGIEEYYYLPQEVRITTEFNTDAVVFLPPISADTFYYASGYAIFYRIYLSGEAGGSSTSMSLINSSLVSDYNAFYPLTDPSNVTSIPSLNTFSDRRYFDLEFPISRLGGVLVIRFPTEAYGYPTISLDGSIPHRIARSRTLIAPEPKNDLFFRNTAELNNNANATSAINSDVAPGANIGHAYVSMYIVAVGQNPTNFSRMYGKPTFISVFKLPNAY